MFNRDSVSSFVLATLIVIIYNIDSHQRLEQPFGNTKLPTSAGLIELSGILLRSRDANFSRVDKTHLEQC